MADHSLSLVALSVCIYFIQVKIFRTPRDTLFYLFQDLAFVPISVLMVTLIIDQLLRAREKRALLKKMNMVIGAFFSEVGTTLLKSFANFDLHYDKIRRNLVKTSDWSEQDFSIVRKRLREYDYNVNSEKGDLEGLKNFLIGKRDFLLRLLENPNLLEHESFTDVLWAVFHLTEELASRADVRGFGTSSLRRAAQILSLRPDLRTQSLRGNVDTRLRKAMEGQYDAILLAGAGLTRLGLAHRVTEWLSLDAMLPAPGQGALAVQCRDEDQATLRLLAALEDDATRKAVTAERAFLSGLGGGCAVPVAAYGGVESQESNPITLTGLVISEDGKKAVRVAGQGTDPLELGNKLAQKAIRQGADEILRLISIH